MTSQITKKKALSLYEGSQAKLAKALGISRQAVHKVPDGPVPESWRNKLRYELHPSVFLTAEDKKRFERALQ